MQAANAATNLDELKQAIESFDGIESKKTAAGMIFADGNADAPLMIIAEKPSADDERAAKPLSGERGYLLDKAMACIDKKRDHDDAEHSIYMTTLLNWRPPGNRGATAAEIAVSMPFLERHIALIKPKAILVCGVEPARALLGRSEGISRLRKEKHTYKTLAEGLQEAVQDIPVVTTYAIENLLATPLKKKGFWQDLLKINAI